MGKYKEEDIETLKWLMWKKSVSWVFDNYEKEEIQELNEIHKMGKAFNAGVEAVIELFDNNYLLRPKEEVVQVDVLDKIKNFIAEKSFWIKGEDDYEFECIDIDDLLKEINKLK
jgi:hypothetical protein